MIISGFDFLQQKGGKFCNTSYTSYLKPILCSIGPFKFAGFYFNLIILKWKLYLNKDREKLHPANFFRQLDANKMNDLFVIMWMKWVYSWVIACGRYYAKIRGVSGRNCFVSVRAAFASIIERKWSPQCHLGLSALALCGAWLIFLTRRTGEKWRCDATRASPRTHRRDSYYKCYEAGNKYFIRHAYGKRCARRRV